MPRVKAQAPSQYTNQPFDVAYVSKVLAEIWAKENGCEVNVMVTDKHIEGEDETNA